MIVVIPSARQIHLDYLTPLIASGARFIVVDDTEGSIDVDHPQFEVYNWHDRAKMLGPLDEAFPRRNGACRDFGFYVAWHSSDDDEVIVALDDDCLVDSRTFPEDVVAALSVGPRALVAGEGRHFNVLDLYETRARDLFPRGFPYSSRVDYLPWEAGEPQEATPAFNLGLWTGIFDVNAIDKIRGTQWHQDEARLRQPSALLPAGCLVSVCSMNMQFRRRVVPAVFQLPMHIDVAPSWVVDRYGDIWGGFILKLLMDRAGDAMTVGAPMIRHLKEGDLQRNMWQEHPAHLINDEMIDLLVESAEGLDGSYLDMMAALGERLGEHAQRATPMLARYLEVLAPSIKGWTTALRNSP